MMTDYIIGIDLGGTHLRIGAVTDEGVVHSPLICSNSALDDGSHAIISVANFIRNYILQNSLENVSAVSIGIPGTVSKDRKRIYSIPNLPDTKIARELENINIVDLLSEKLNRQVFINRDVHNLLQYEITTRGLKNKGIVAGFYIGTGYGNSVYINDHFLTGKNGVAGELGHAPLCDSSLLCNCGRRGCLECCASGAVLARIKDELFPEEHISELFKKHGHEKILVDFIKNCARPIATVVNLLDPDYIVIGGGVIHMEGFPRESLTHDVLENVRAPYPAQDLNMIFTSESKEIGILGAAYYARENMKRKDRKV